MPQEEKQEVIAEPVEIVPVQPHALEVMERSAIDIQVATAHQYPRSLAMFTKRAKEMVSVDKETAESCIYRRPVGKEGGQVVYAEGESIRLAEIVAACYGNLRVEGKIIEITAKEVKAQGVALDLESNYAVKADVVESIVDRNGKTYSERMRLVVSKAAQSKAIRDAIFRVVSKSLCKSIVSLAREVAFGKERPLGERRASAVQWINKLSIGPERVFAALGVKGVEDLGEQELEILTGIRTALKDGDTTLDESFPPLGTPSTQASGVGGLKDRLKADSAAKPEPKEARYYCQGCDKESDTLADGGVCPFCKSKRIIDRQAQPQTQNLFEKGEHAH
jgi:hypothetical protein